MWMPAQPRQVYAVCASLTPNETRAETQGPYDGSPAVSRSLHFRVRVLSPQPRSQRFSVLVSRNVLEAPQVLAGFRPKWPDLKQKDRVFDVTSYRAGELHGYSLPYMVRALLFVSVDNARGATRFANGDWTDIGGGDANYRSPRSCRRLGLVDQWHGILVSRGLTPAAGGLRANVVRQQGII
jgi:hypothetical protein